jgi:hypothetical protein
MQPVSRIGVLAIVGGGLLGFALLVGALILWLSGRNEPPRRDD